MIKSILYGNLNPIRAIVRSVLDNNRCNLLLRGVLVFSFRGKYCVDSNDKIILK